VTPSLDIADPDSDAREDADRYAKPGDDEFHRLYDGFHLSFLPVKNLKRTSPQRIEGSVRNPRPDPGVASTPTSLRPLITLRLPTSLRPPTPSWPSFREPGTDCFPTTLRLVPVFASRCDLVQGRL
jgi:hypothetical protein